MITEKQWYTLCEIMNMVGPRGGGGRQSAWQNTDLILWTNTVGIEEILDLQGDNQFSEPYY